MKKTPLFQRVYEQAGAGGEAFYDSNGQLDSMTKKYVRDNYKIEPLKYDSEMGVNEKDTSKIPGSEDTISSETNFIFVADCGCQCTTQPKDNRLPYFKGITKTGHLCCSYCFRRCKVCNDIFMATQGTIINKKFVCHRHLLGEYLRLIVFWVSHLFFEWEKEEKRSDKNERNI